MVKSVSVKEMVLISLLVALQIILTRFLSIQLPMVRIGFAFIPLALCSMLYGPVKGGIAAMIADILGMLLFPSGNVYFPGFTATAFLSGCAYGVFLYKRPKNIVNLTGAAITVCLIINLGLDTLWLSILLGKGYLALLPARAIKSVVLIPVQVTMLKLLWNYVVERLKLEHI